jgi:hypothetical protein
VRTEVDCGFVKFAKDARQLFIEVRDCGAQCLTVNSFFDGL